MEQKFKIGDRVVVVSSTATEYILNPKLGARGTVCKLSHENSPFVGVEFDDKFTGGHECHGSSKMGHGHYVLNKFLEKINRLLTVKQWKENLK